MQKRVLIIGAGRLGLSLYCALRDHKNFNKPLLVGRSNRWQTFLQEEQIVLSNLDIVLEKPLDFLFICTQDSEIARVSQQLLSYSDKLLNTCIVHSSGALSLEPLRILEEQGCKIGSMHPARAFPNPCGYNAFKGCPVAIEGDDDVTSVLEQLTAQIDAEAFRIPSSLKAKYHAAACIASNYLVTLAHISTTLFEEVGISATQSRKLSEALMRSSLEHMSSQISYQNALSGPIQRGDNHTIAKHMATLSGNAFAKVYAELGRLSLSLSNHSHKKESELLEILRNSISMIT